MNLWSIILWEEVGLPREKHLHAAQLKVLCSLLCSLGPWDFTFIQCPFFLAMPSTPWREYLALLCFLKRSFFVWILLLASRCPWNRIWQAVSAVLMISLSVFNDHLWWTHVTGLSCSSGHPFLPAAAASSSQTLHVLLAWDLWVLRGDPDVPLPLLLFQNRLCGWSLRPGVFLCLHEHLQVWMSTYPEWLALFFSVFTVTPLFQHQPAAQPHDHWPDPADSPLSGPGPGSAVLWLFHLQNVMVGQLRCGWGKAICITLGEVLETSLSRSTLMLAQRSHGSLQLLPLRVLADAKIDGWVQNRDFCSARQLFKLCFCLWEPRGSCNHLFIEDRV